MHDLVDLERDEHRGGDQRQVLGPALLEPESDRLNPFQQRVAEHADDLCRGDEEDPFRPDARE